MKFPDFIKKLPNINLKIDGLESYLSQGNNHQIVFMNFDKDISIPNHSHSAQFGIVLEGKIDLLIDGCNKTYYKGDIYVIAKDTMHSAKIYAPYSDITFFDEKNRFDKKL